MIKNKFIASITKHVLVDSVQKCSLESINEQQLRNHVSNRIRPWGRMITTDETDLKSTDMAMSILNSLVLIEFKTSKSDALLGNFDTNYTIWAAVSQLQEIIMQKHAVMGFLCIITSNATRNKKYSFAPLVDNTKGKTRIVMSQGRETLFISNHTIEWHELKDGYQLCIISLGE